MTIHPTPAERLLSMLEDDRAVEALPAGEVREGLGALGVDPARSIGGFLRLGNRANEGHAEMTVTLYVGDGRVLFMFKRAAIDNNDAFDAGGCRFEVIEPSQTRRKIITGLELLEGKQDSLPPKKHGNMPL